MKNGCEFNRKKFFFFLLLLIYLLVFVLNYNTIHTADDYTFYNNVWNNGHNFDFVHIFNRTKSFYLAWSGRFVSTFINYTFLKLDKNIFNLVNSIVFVIYIYLIYKIVINSKKYSPLLLILIFLLIWILIPQFGEVMLWQIGSVIYLWTLTLNLFFVYLFINFFKKNNKIKDNFIILVLFFILSVVAGNGFETNSIMLVSFVSEILIYTKFINKRKTPVWAIISYIGLIIGTLFNFLSPGNAIRMETMGSNGSPMDRIFYGIGIFFYRGIIETKIFIVIPIFIILYVIYLISRQNNLKTFFNKKVISISILWLIFIFTLFSFSIYINRFTLNEFLGWFYLNTRIFVLFFIFLIVLLILNIFLCIIFKKIIFKSYNKEFSLIVFFLFFSAILGISTYLIIPYSWPRSYMGMSTFLIIATCYIVNNLISQKNKYLALLIYISLIGSLIIFFKTYKSALLDNMEAKKWSVTTEENIQKQIKDNKKYILIKTFMSNNKYNAASVEKWVIPVIISDTVYMTKDGVHKDYEWINKAVTNYYFGNNNAWNEGERIIGYE